VHRLCGCMHARVHSRGYPYCHAGGQPKGVKLSLLSPATVKVDEVFELTVSVKNERPRKDFKVDYIDIYDSYVSGFVVVSNSPAHESSEHIPILDCSSYTFDVSIKPGETKAFTFKLRAVEPGVHRGDIEVHEGMRSIKKLAQTHVR